MTAFLNFQSMKRFPWLNEIVSIPLGLLAFWAYPYLAMSVEDNPAVWGVGTLQKFVFAFALVALANGFGGLYVKLVFPNVYEYKEDGFLKDYEDCTPFQRCVILIGIFTVYFWAFVAAASAL